MIIARFEFWPEVAAEFAWAASQSIVEMQFEDLPDFIEYCEPIEGAVKECTVFTGDQVICLSDFSTI